MTDLSKLYLKFQSAPRLSARGNLRMNRQRSTLLCFNPPLAFRQGET